MQEERRLPLTIGLAIPVIMIGLVAVSIYVPGLFSPPPRFDFLYVTWDNYGGPEYVVERGQLVRRAVTYPAHYTPGPKQLFVHHVAANESVEVSFEEAKTLPLDSSVQSPDGFEVACGTHGDGFFPFFFSGESDYNALYLTGHHAAKRLHLKSGDRWYYDRPRFLGWIVSRR